MINLPAPSRRYSPRRLYSLKPAAPRRWPLVARQFAIAVGVVAAMTGVFWALDTFVLDQVAARAAGKVYLISSLRVSALMVTSGVLVTVLSAVHLVRLCLRVRTMRPAAR